MMASQASHDERWQKTLSQSKSILAVFVLALFVRATVSAVSLADLRDDPDAYRAIAKTIIQSGVFGLTGPDGEVRSIAFRPPLYPYVLSWTTPDVVPIAVLHVLLGSATAVFIYLATMSFSSDRRVAWFAAVLVIVDPILLQQSTVVMTETMAGAIVSAVLWQIAVAARWGFSLKRSLAIGTLLALAYLCRPTFLVWAALIVLGLAWMAFRAMRRRDQEWPWTPVFAIAGVIGITMAGWMFRNQQVVGHPVWATTHGGYTLLLANNPMYYRHLQSNNSGQAWDPQSFFDAYSHRYQGDPTTEEFWERDWSDAGDALFPPDASEIDDDRLAMSAAKALIRRQPVTFVRSCFSRLWRMWKPLPHVTSQRSAISTLAVGIYFSIFYGMVVVGVWRLRKCEICLHSVLGWAILSMLLTLSAVHAVYWSNVRMRAPAVPGLAIVAAGCIYGRQKDRSIQQ
ncbi:ArnT family glycosyltransferase [Rubripirellula reticaptiva]|uniref:Uncharacterized protein n=1 Tax=Rubripirellula reticaptiva TaxID=2528013 RepID=A0A5C6EJW9_9BACT|nr:phospholipid carrier-dependent glycosyltransferase [Rubripirellula reticaptiva]TWU47931.1 hypothetical protein Poly59_47750 [Rubripirellula reticaptiva]